MRLIRTLKSYVAGLQYQSLETLEGVSLLPNLTPPGGADLRGGNLG